MSYIFMLIVITRYNGTMQFDLQVLDKKTCEAKVRMWNRVHKNSSTYYKCRKYE